MTYLFRKNLYTGSRDALGYDPDGFGSLIKDPLNNYKLYEQIVEEDLRKATEGAADIFGDDSGNRFGIEDVHGIEVAAEAAVEQQIENDPR